MFGIFNLADFVFIFAFQLLSCWCEMQVSAAKTLLTYYLIMSAETHTFKVLMTTSCVDR